MRRTVLTTITALVTASLLAVAAHAAQVRTATMEIAPDAVLVEGGQAVQLTVRAGCPKKAQVLEAFVYVTQDGNQSQFAPVPVTCDGRLNIYVVTVRAVDFTFHTGEARASGYLLVDDKRGSVSSVSPGGPIQIR